MLSKLAGLVSIFIIMLFSGCLSKEANYYKFTDPIGKAVFKKNTDFQRLYLCKKTTKDVCLLFDRDGDYLDETNPKRCHKVNGELYCPLPGDEEPQKAIVQEVDKEKEKEIEEEIENQIEELEKEEEAKNPKKKLADVIQGWF